MSEETHKHCHACIHHEPNHHHHHHHHQEQKFTNEKSLVVLDIKPKGVETDLGKVCDFIQNNIFMDGLSWGESKIEEIGYGIKKLVIGAVVKDKVCVEELVEKIRKADGVQDVDVVSFNKI